MTNKDKKIYFASDFHLGAPNKKESRKREEKIIHWLNSIEKDAAEIYLVGDLFDFWFEYKTVVPKGFVRLLGKIAQLCDAGIPVHVFIGNHDMWMFDYLPQELGVQLHRDSIKKEFNGKKFLIGHGDGLGPGDHGYKFIKRVFANRFCQWLFARLHPNFGIGMANFWSKKSRSASKESEEVFQGKENEWLALYSKDYLKKEHIDYFVFGHRHLPIDLKLEEKSRYINLGEWMNYSTYAVFDGNDIELLSFESENQSINKIG